MAEANQVSTEKSLQEKTWLEGIRAFAHPRVITMLFLGFSAGIPILLIFSSLSLWLREAGVSRSAVTFFSWAALGYSFKFVWAPLVDKLPIPFLTSFLGRRRSWMILSQFAIIVAICIMAFTNPASERLVFMAIAAVLLGFSSATQDIVIDAYRIESAKSDLQAMMSSTYIAGYRIGMLVAGAGALYLASYFGSDKGNYNYQAWQYSYLIMGLTMLVGVITTLIIKEPELENSNQAHQQKYSTKQYLQFLLLFVIAASIFIACFFVSTDFVKEQKAVLKEVFGNKPLASVSVETIRLAVGLLITFFGMKLVLATQLFNKEMVDDTYIAPVGDFFKRYGIGLAFLILALVGLYRISDIVLGVISNVFYQDLGFTKPQIASVVKSFGLFMTIAGGFLGGILSVRFSVMKILFLGAVLSALTNILFILLAQMGNNLPMLYMVIAADNLSAGLASAAFIAFLSSLTNIKFTAIQYAIFSSLMTLLPKILGGYSGAMVDSVGYSNFFLITAVMGIPVLFLIVIAGRKLELQKFSLKEN